MKEHSLAVKNEGRLRALQAAGHVLSMAAFHKKLNRGRTRLSALPGTPSVSVFQRTGT